MKTKKIALYGILGAMALVLSFLESTLLPVIPFLPAGAKPGLSNIVTMFTADYSGFFGAFYITAIKALFAFLTRGATAGMMSLAGGMLSMVAMCALLRMKNCPFSYAGIGIICALMHNMGQLAVACAVTGTFAVAGYAPVLLLFSLLTGLVTGTILQATLPAVKKAVGDFQKSTDKGLNE